MQWSRILTLVASSSLVLSGDMAAYVRADNIDVIFDGVKSTRESLKPCRFNLGSSLDMTDKDGKIQSIHTDWLVTVMLEECVFVRKSGGSSSLLRQHEVVVLSDNSVAVYSLSMGSGADAFDPRLLGLCIGPHYNSNIPNALRVGHRQEKMIKDDILGEIVCKNISVRDAEKHRLTFWIDPKQRFQVLRYEYDSPGILLETVESKYDNKFAEGVLPIEVVTKGRNLQGGNSYVKTLKLSGHESIVNRPLTLTDMDLPVGAPYSDIRAKKRIGYWDGEKLVSEVVRTRVEPRESASEHRRKNWFGQNWIYVLLPIIAVALVFTWAFVRGQNREK